MERSQKQMICNQASLGILELAEIIKSEIPGGLVYENCRDLNAATVVLLTFERYYFRNGNCAGLTILLTEKEETQTADIVGFSGGSGMFNISWGANESFANIAAKILRKYDFIEVEVGKHK